MIGYEANDVESRAVNVGTADFACIPRQYMSLIYELWKIFAALTSFVCASQLMLFRPTYSRSLAQCF